MKHHPTCLTEIRFNETHNNQNVKKQKQNFDPKGKRYIAHRVLSGKKKSTVLCMNTQDTEKWIDLLIAKEAVFSAGTLQGTKEGSDQFSVREVEKHGARNASPNKCFQK